MKYKKIIYFLILVVVLELGFYALKKDASFLKEPAGLDSMSGQSIMAERTRLSKMMDQKGVEETYQEFKKQYESKNFGLQHTIAHIVGELIYQKKGISGLTICDSTFAFGCYHSFYSQALADKGLAVVPLSDKFCVDKFGPLGTGCQHGIGHGLMDYFGPEKLLLALEACGETTQIKKLFGCTSGVFMEYNVPIVISAEDTRTIPRKLNARDPYAPCPTLPEKYQDSCYYEMPQWWNKEGVFGDDYVKIGKLCQAINLPEKRESCFLGVGNVVGPSSNYEVGETVRKCEMMPNKESQIICKSGASWSFFSSGVNKEKADQVCANLSLKERERCVKESDLIGKTN